MAKKIGQYFFKFRPASEAELKAIDGDKPDGFVAGWASTSDMDFAKHVVTRNAFNESIKRRGLSGPKGIKLLHNHSWNHLVGGITKLEYRGEDLWIEAQLNLNISYAKDLYEAIKSAGGLSFSVGFFIEEYSYNEKKDILTIIKGDLFEVSIVPFPMNEEAGMEEMKSMAVAFKKSLDAHFANVCFADEGEDEEFQLMAEINTTTLADFEKAMVKSGLVAGRSAAREITLAVKRNLELFAAKSNELLQEGNSTETRTGENDEPQLSVEDIEFIKKLTKASEDRLSVIKQLA